MGASEPVVEREENEKREEGEEEGRGREREGEREKEREVERDIEKGEEMETTEKAVVENEQEKRNDDEFHQMAMLQRLNPTNPLRIVINGATRMATPSPSQFSQRSQPRSTPTPQPSIATLSSSAYTNKIWLFIFTLHMIVASGLVCFLIFKGIQGLLIASDSVKRKERMVLKYLLPQVEAASLLSITLAFLWQKAVREWPKFMVPFILWCSFVMSLAAGILLLCFQKPPTDGVGVCFIAFSIGNGLYACWVSRRVGFCSKVLVKSLEPVSKFPELNHPIYLTLGVGFLWMSMWILAVIGALNFYFPPLIIVLLVLSLAWTAEVMRNVANMTVSRAIALYYLRGMQLNPQFCFQRALTKNLGSACLGSLFVPAIEALRIVARALNLLEGEDEFMFCCAPCCLKVMESVFNNGNGWAFVQIAAYGKDFVRASRDTWGSFKSREMDIVVDADMTSSVCFLTGVCSGSICVIMAAAWTSQVHMPFTATISLLVFFVGYLMTRIAMALPHACVSCYYVCYAENPENRLFDKTIKDRLALLKSDREVIVPTPRVRRQYNPT